MEHEGRFAAENNCRVVLVILFNIEQCRDRGGRIRGFLMTGTEGQGDCLSRFVGKYTVASSLLIAFLLRLY